MSQVPLEGQRNPCVVNNSLNTAGTLAAPYRPTSVERPWCASHSAATPATWAAAYDVPELRLTSNVPVVFVSARHTDSPGAVMSTSLPLADDAQRWSAQFDAATAITSS